jgi:hypothetical protein
MENRLPGILSGVGLQWLKAVLLSEILSNCHTGWDYHTSIWHS